MKSFIRALLDRRSHLGDGPQSRVQQSLQFFSGCCILGLYALLFTKREVAFVLWLGALGVRRLGSRLFEPERRSPPFERARSGAFRFGQLLVDPLVDVMVYAGAPLRLLRGELYEAQAEQSLERRTL